MSAVTTRIEAWTNAARHHDPNIRAPSSESEEKKSSVSVRDGVVVLRKSIRDLSAAEIAEFVSRLLVLRKKGASDGFASVHSDHYYNSHVGPAFLPWHRKHLRYFELQLQQVSDEDLKLKPNPNFGLPYWDWENDDEDYSQNLIWCDHLMGGNGSPVKSGPFSHSWNLERRFGLGTSSLPNADDITVALAAAVYDIAPWNTDSAGGFRNLLEGWYERPFCKPGPQLSKRVDVWIGGSSKWPGTSAIDPVFWLHHCNVDRLWAIWQLNNPKELKAETTTYPKVVPDRPGHALNDRMKPFADKATPASQLDFTSWYIYQYPMVFPKCGSNVLPGERTLSDVSLFVCKDQLYAAWRDPSNGIKISQTADGQSWSKGKNPLSYDDKTLSAPRLATAPLAVDNPKDILLWFQGTGNSIKLSARNASDGEFGSAELHPEGAKTKSSPNSFVFGDNVCYVVWQGPKDEILLSHTTSKGLTKWTDPMPPLSKDERTKSALGVSVSGPRVYLWWRNCTDEICMSSTDDPSGCGTWTKPVKPLPKDCTNSAVSLTTLNDKHFLVFQGTDASIRLSSSADGITWTDSQRIIRCDATSAAPSIAAFKGRLYVAYKAQSGNCFYITPSAI